MRGRSRGGYGAGRGRGPKDTDGGVSGGNFRNSGPLKNPYLA